MKRLLIVFLILTFVLAACGASQEEPSDEVVAAPTLTPMPTATVVGSSSNLVTTNLDLPTPTPLPPQSGDMGSAQPAVMDSLNTWLQLPVPAGWQIVDGPDGTVLARDIERVPETTFVEVRKWDGSVSLSSWGAYLPDGVEERNGHASISLGGLEWDGVFVLGSAYRAFYAVADDGVISYSLLVYVPTDGIGDPVAVFDAEAAAINGILRTMVFGGY